VIAGYYEHDISDDDLIAAAEWYDNNVTMSQKGMTMSMDMTVVRMAEYEQAWRRSLLAKGYRSMDCTFRIEPVNDEVRISLSFFNEDYSCTVLPTELARSTIKGLWAKMGEINTWIGNQPAEHEAREQQLLKDFARMKERIASSRLPDVLKAEAAALLKAMTTNILPPPEGAPVEQAEPVSPPSIN
jgi:hypothetical protein